MKAVIDARELRRVLRATEKFCMNSQTRPAQSFIRLGFQKNGCCMEAVAVDGYTMAVEWGVCESIDEDFAVLVRRTLPPISRKQGELATVERLEDGRTAVQIGDMQFAYPVPDLTEFINYRKVIPQASPEFRIGVNGEYLMKALKAASTTERLNREIELRFYGARQPFVIRNHATGLDPERVNTKLVMPVRLRPEE